MLPNIFIILYDSSQVEEIEDQSDWKWIVFYQKSFQKTRAYIQQIYHFSFFSFFFLFVNDIIIVWALIMLIIEFAFWYHLSFKIYDDEFNISGIRSFFFFPCKSEI